MSAGTSGMDLQGLRDLDREELLKRWHLLYEEELPANISKSMLIQAIAYRMQEKTLGGLKPATRRFLKQCMSERQPGISANNLKIGTRLLREWHGNTYEVTVLEKEVLFNGKRYRSLTQVARIITGTQWSGPVFFGLRKKDYA